ncbi:MAG: hypothetical protein B6226_01015 [Candidatus Cloacimonetes bacterium 4572_65]|nr:MAG: hypothetical protein B6226_01015 [Candidatus Cloacimonetes bacterium 4572_65]
MKNLLLVLLILSISFLTADRFIARVETPSLEELTYLTGGDYDVLGMDTERFIDILVDKPVFESLQARGISIVKYQTEEQVKENLQLRDERNLDGYRDYDTVVSELEAIESNNSDICKLYDLGDSWGKTYFEEGNANYANYQHEIWALKLSDNVDTDEDEPNFYFVAEHHAREPISLEVTMAILNDLLDSYSSDIEAQNLINNSQIWFIPLLNPDGHKLVTDQDDIWWRKNIRDNDGNGYITPMSGNYWYNDGVDLNRNYGFNWGYLGATSNIFSQTYHGIEPWSEPETVVMQQLMEDINFVAGISYHSYGELVLYPLGYSEEAVAPDYVALSALGTEMAASIDRIGYGTYTPSPSHELYACMGTSDDYYYGAHGVFAYTFELADTFIPGASEVGDICTNNLEAARILMGRVNHSTLTGHIFDSSTDAPLVGEIHVAGIDDNGSFINPMKSDSSFGRYYRLLPPGEYEVTFSAHGYHDFNIIVTITDDAITELEIGLTAIETTSNMEFLILDSDTNHPLESVELLIPYSEMESIYSDINGEAVFESLALGVYDFSIDKDHYKTKVITLPILDVENSLTIYLEKEEIDDFEETTIDDSWSQSGSEYWTITSEESYSGSNSITCGDISYNSSAIIQKSFVAESNSELRFYMKTSAEINHLNLTVYIDGSTVGIFSGESEWTEVIFTVEPGTHELTFAANQMEYSSQDERYWIDYVIYPYNEQISDNLAPRNLTITGGSFDYEFDRTLNWAAPMNIANYDLVGYRIYRNFQFVEEIGNIETYEDIDSSPMSDGRTYYHVTTVLDNPEYESEPSNTVSIIFEPYIGNDNSDSSAVPMIYGNYPNPFNPSTTIAFSLPRSEKVSISIYNIKGQKVKDFTNQVYPAGNYNLEWNGTNNSSSSVSSGIYFMSGQIGESTFQHKMILLK